MAIKPIEGFYVHDEETNTDGIAKVSIDAVHEFVEDVSGAVEGWLDAHPEATTTVQDDSLTTAKYKDGSVTTDKLADEAVTFGKIADGVLTYVTPEMFGAKGDGSTDDTQALQRTFDYSVTHGLIAYIPSDMVVGWGNPVYMKSNLHFRIDGELRAVAGNAQLETYDRLTETPGYTSSHDVVVDGGGKINMQGHILTNTGPTPLRIHHAKNVLVRDISICDCSKFHSIECGGTDGLTVENVKFLGMHENGENGFHEFIQLEDVTESGTGGAVPYDGTVTKNVVIRGCYFGAGDNGGACYTAVGVHSDPSDYFDNFLIEDCEIDKSVVMALRFAKKVKNMTVRNCSITREPNGGTYAQATMYIGDDMHDLTFDGNTFGRCFGRHAIFGNGTSTAQYDVVLKNNIFYEYGTSGNDALGIFINCSSTNMQILNNVFKSSLATSNRPVHVGTTTLNNNTTNLQITGNTFFSKALDMDNYLRWNSLMGRKVLYENSSGAKAEATYTLTDNYQKYDFLKIRYTLSGTGTRELIVSPEVTQVDLRYTWISAALTSPLQTQDCRMIITFSGTAPPSLTINQNQLVRHIKTFNSSGVVTEDKVIPERISQSPSGTYNFLQIDKVTGINMSNKIVYV